MNKTWMFRALPNNKDRMKEFKSDNLIGAGWDDIESLVGKDINDIGEMLNNTYEYESTRSMSSDKSTLDINDLTLDLRSSLKVPKTCAELTHRYRDIQIALGEVTDDKANEKEFITVEYPIRPDVNVKIEIPKDLKKSESVRVGEFIKTIFFDEVE